MMNPRKRRGPAWGKLALILAGAAVLAAVWRWTPLADYLTAELEDPGKVSYLLIGGAVVLLVAFTVIARRVLAKRMRAA